MNIISEPIQPDHPGGGTFHFRILDLLALTTYIAAVIAAVSYSPDHTLEIVIPAIFGWFFYRAQHSLARITFWTIMGSFFALAAGKLMIATGRGPYLDGYPNDIRMLVAAESAMLLSSLYGSRRELRYFPWIIAGNILGMHQGMESYIIATDQDIRPYLLHSIIFSTPIMTILFACIGWIAYASRHIPKPQEMGDEELS